MLCGHPPFVGETQDDVDYSILNDIPTFPIFLDNDATDLIQKVLAPKRSFLLKILWFV